MESLLKDLQYGARTFLSSPGFTAVAVLMLALGIGANSAIFSVVDAVLLRPLPFNEADRLVFISETSEQVPGMSVSVPNYLDWRNQNKSFEDIAAFRGQNFNLTGRDEPEQLPGSQVSASLFSTMKVPPVLGRTFSEDEDRPGGNRVVVLSHGLWQRMFGGDQNILERDLVLNGESYRVIGVMPPTFRFPSLTTELWTSLMRISDQPGMVDRGNHPGIYVVGRLRDGVTLEQSRSDMAAIAQSLAEQYPTTNKGNSVTIVGLHDRLVRDIRPSLIVLMVAVGLVLMIACANVANLLLARATTRQKEIAIRTALGAGRLRLVRQLLTESVLLGLIGGAIGLLIAHFGVKLLISITPDNVPRLSDAGLNTTVLLFAMIVSVMTGLLFGLAPALQASKSRLNETLKEGGRGSGAGARHLVRNIFVVAEVAFSLVLLITAGLMIKSFYRLQQEDPGIDVRDVIAVQISLPATKYRDEHQRRAFYRRLMDQFKSEPRLESAGMSMPVPLSGNGWQTSFHVEGLPEPDPGQVPSTDIARVSTDYFKVMGIRLLQGRFFTDADNETSQQVAIVDETFAKKYWPDDVPLGKRIKLGGPRSNSPWLSIVGVVNHIKNYGVDADSRVETYVPYAQSPITSFVLVFKTRIGRDQTAAVVRQQVRQVDADMPIYNIRSMEELQANTVSSKRIAMFLLSVFAGVALLLASIGLYGVISYSVVQRTHEIGVRMAMGAQRGHILGQLLGQGIRLTGIALGIGLILSFIGTRYLSNLLFGVDALDKTTFIGIPIVLTAVAMLATYIPARRATKVDPIIALRYE